MEKERTLRREREKSAKFWAPTLRGPTLRGPPFGAPPFGAPPFGAPPFGARPLWAPHPSGFVEHIPFRWHKCSKMEPLPSNFLKILHVLWNVTNWTCSRLCGKPWKSLSDMCCSNPKQRTIGKRWFTFHWCQGFHHHELVAIKDAGLVVGKIQRAELAWFLNDAVLLFLELCEKLLSDWRMDGECGCNRYVSGVSWVKKSLCKKSQEATAGKIHIIRHLTQHNADVSKMCQNCWYQDKRQYVWNILADARRQKSAHQVQCTE